MNEAYKVTQLGMDRLLFDWMKEFFTMHHRMPSMREVARHFQKSLGWTQDAFDRLVGKGVLERQPGTSGFRIIKESPVGISVPVYSRLNV